jgi:hypothetical protein
MHIKEIELLIKELDAIASMMHLLPVEILEESINDIQDEIWVIKDFKDEEHVKIEYIDILSGYKNKFLNEISGRESR